MGTSSLRNDHWGRRGHALRWNACAGAGGYGICHGILWRWTHAAWNSLMHALHGNTSSGSGGPNLLPAWLHRPGYAGGHVVIGRVTGQWRYVAQAPQPAMTQATPVFDVWAMSLPGEDAQAAQPAAAPVVVAAQPVAAAAPAQVVGVPPGGVWTLPQIVAAVQRQGTHLGPFTSRGQMACVAGHTYLMSPYSGGPVPGYLDHDAVTEVMTALQVLYPWYGRGPFPPVPGSGPGSAPPGPPPPRMAQTATKAGAISLPAKQLATHKAPPGYVPGGITYKAPPSNVSPRLPAGSSGPSFKAPPDQLPPAVGTGMATGGGGLHIGPPPTPHSMPLGPAPPNWKAPPAVPMAAAGAPDYAMRAPTGMHELVGFALQVVEDFPGPADIAASAVWWWDGTLSDSLAQLLAATGDADGAATALLLAANLMAASADAQATAFVCAWATVEAQVVGRGRPWPSTVIGGPPPGQPRRHGQEG